MTLNCYKSEFREISQIWEASIRRAARPGLYAADEPSMTQLVADSDDKLFDNIRYNRTTLATF